MLTPKQWRELGRFTEKKWGKLRTVADVARSEWGQRGCPPEVHSCEVRWDGKHWAERALEVSE